MNSRILEVPAGNRRVIDFQTTYSQNWSVEEKRGEDIAAEDVANAVFLVKRKVSETDEAAVVEKTLTEGISVTAGSAQVTLDAEDTKDLQGSYIATLRLTLADGGVVDWMDEDFDGTPFITLTFIQGAVEEVS